MLRRITSSLSPRGRARSPWSAWGAVLLGAFTVAGASAADSEPPAPSSSPAAKRRFDIPAGEAFTALRTFAVQSGEQLIYKAETLEGVRTAAVRGRYTPREALARMLVRTTLAVTQDEKTGTLAIRPIADAPERPNPHASQSNPDSAAKKKSPQK